MWRALSHRTRQEYHDHVALKGGASRAKKKSCWKEQGRKCTVAKNETTCGEVQDKDGHRICEWKGGVQKCERIANTEEVEKAVVRVTARGRRHLYVKGTDGETRYKRTRGVGLDRAPGAIVWAEVVRLLKPGLKVYHVDIKGIPSKYKDGKLTQAYKCMKTLQHHMLRVLALGGSILFNKNDAHIEYTLERKWQDKSNATTKEKAKAQASRQLFHTKLLDEYEDYMDDDSVIQDIYSYLDVLDPNKIYYFSDDDIFDEIEVLTAREYVKNLITQSQEG